MELSLECQLAQVQMKRYLAGETLPDVLVADLTQHLGECEACSAVAEQQKEDLKALVTPREQAGPKTSILDRIRAFLMGLVAMPVEGEGGGSSSILAKIRQNRPVVLSFALGGVLVLMTAVAGNPTRLFGPKVAAAEEGQKSAEQEDANDGETSTTLAATDGPESEDPIAHADEENGESPSEFADETEPSTGTRGMEESLIVARSNEPELQVQAAPARSTPGPTQRKTSNSSVNRRVQTPTRNDPPKEPKVQVTVYDAEGNPINQGENK